MPRCADGFGMEKPAPYEMGGLKLSSGVCAGSGPGVVSGARRSVAAAAARVSSGALAIEATLLGGLGKRHVVAVDTQHARAVHDAAEAAQCAVNGFLVANFNANGQSNL